MAAKAEGLGGGKVLAPADLTISTPTAGDLIRAILAAAAAVEEEAAGEAGRAASRLSTSPVTSKSWVPPAKNGKSSARSCRNCFWHDNPPKPPQWTAAWATWAASAGPAAAGGAGRRQ